MKRNKLFKFLASIKLAVILFLMFATILALATYYESVYDTETAQHLVYKSPFFAVFLGIFFVNIFCSTMMRFPWKRKQFGFVVTHAGILVLLSSAAFTMAWGVDGSMMVQEGQSSTKVLLNQPVFFVGPPGKGMREIPAEFRWRPPTPTRPAKIDLGAGITAQVEQYLHHSRVDKRFEPSESGVPALELRIFNQQVDQKQWLTVGRGDLDMGPAKIRMLRANSQEHLARLLQSGSVDSGELQLLVAGQPFQIKVAELTPGKVMQVGEFQLTLKRYLPHVGVENDELVSKSDKPVNPCVELRVADAKGNWQEWLLFARLPELNVRTESKGNNLQLRVLYIADGGDEHQRGLTFIVDDKQQLWVKIDQGEARKVTVAKAENTGWMNLQFEVSKFIPKAKEHRDFVAVEVDKASQQNAPPPAIQVRFEGAKNPGPYWLERGDVEQIETAQGDPVVVGYAFRSVDVGFPVVLKDFQIEHDPGTTNPAAFKSIVEVDKQEHTIQMNEPLVKGGFTFFQSSYSETPGGPSISIFTVAKDPGIGLKYLGSIMVVMGIALMFALRPNPGGRRKVIGRDGEQKLD